MYTQTARFDDRQHFLTEEELHSAAPSVFATTAHHSRSERFAVIPTIQIIRKLEEEGFGVVGAQQNRAMTPDRMPFTKHMLRLRKKDDKRYVVDDVVFEILMRNANDGSGAHEMLAGLFRIRCLNSLVAMQMATADHKIRHTGRAMDKVIDATFTVMNDADRVMGAVENWSGINLDPEEKLAYAEAVHTVRFPNGDTPVMPQQLLERRRDSDMRDDLWTTTNVIQENVMRGGLSATRYDVTGRRRRLSTRGIKSIDTSVALNKAIWTLGEKMAKHKAA